MRPPLALATLSLAACAAGLSNAPLDDTWIGVRSHNASDVDVYVLCGDHDARWLGLVASRSGAAYTISPAQRRCAEGLNFFLVTRGRGYWVGPFRPQAGTAVMLVIEKYAGLSNLTLSGLP